MNSQTAAAITAIVAAAANRENSGGSPALESNRVLAALLVVHNDSEAASILMALRSGGFSVRHTRVTDETMLRQELKRTAWDVVVAANRMPAWGGLDVLRIVQAHDAVLPVLLIYGEGGSSSAIDAIREGARDGIQINELPERLARSVSRELERREQRQLAGEINNGPAVAADRAQQAIAVLPIAVYDCDASGRILSFNAAAAALWGREPQIGVDKWTGAQRMFTTDGQPIAPGEGPTAKCLRTGEQIRTSQILIERPDNSRRHVEQHVRPLRDADGHLTGAISFLADQTDQREATEQARLARKVLAAVSQGVLICGADRRILSVNQTFSAMTGYAQEQLVGSSCAVLQGPDSSAQTILDMRRALEADQTFHGDILNYRKDGSTFWNQLTIDPVLDAQGRVSHFVGILRDVTEHRAQQERVDLAQQIFTQSREGLVITDARRQIIMVNSAFTNITGYTQAEVLGHNPRMLSAHRHDVRFYREMWGDVVRKGSWKGEVWNRNKNGTEYLERLSINVLRDHAGDISHYIGTFSDITEQRAAQEKIDWLSHFDPLTQLPNRDLLADRCAHDINLVQREDRQMTMVVLNIDRFKLINETLGFAVGNKVIKKFARRLVSAVRAQDTVARLGADEFALLLPGETPQGASQVIERLQAVLSEPFGVGDQEADISASIGVAIHPNDGRDFESLFNAAQAAMHLAKEKGGNQHRFYNAGMSADSKMRLALVMALRSAIQHNEMHLVYQPFVDLQTGHINGMEALLRWTHPELGVVSPAAFIPVAEQSGQIVAIGTWVLRQACLDIAHWRTQGLRSVPVSVNLSPLQFRDPGLLDMVRSTLQTHAIDASQICLELTEGAIMDDVTHSEQMMRAFKELGVTLSLDDFGTGYSSLSYLKRFPFDKVKIDQSFVRDINTNDQDGVIVKVVISMAHGLGLRVIAEGVETETQCEFLRRNVCDEIQGYFFSRPIAAPAMAELLREDKRLPAHLRRMQTKERTLLLVDDEPNVVAALKRLLRPDGYRILSAGSGPEGLAMLASHPVDIIIADQRMPGMTGVQFLREAKTLHPQTIRIVLSGHTELQSVTDAINEGAVYRFLTKPWDDEQLRGFIEQAFRHKELADENEQLSLKVMTANQELASSNRQLQLVLDHKQRELVRGENNLDVLREVLTHLALPVLAIDDEGVIAFANTRAESMFGTEQPLLAQLAAVRLPRLHALVGHGHASGPVGYKGPDGNGYQVHQQAMGSSSRSRGTVFTFTPTRGGTAS